MKIAIIDLGTNTFNLLIATIEQQNYSILYTTKRPVKLGEGGINNAIILPAAQERGIVALKEYVAIAQEKGVDKILAFATSAIRSATNGNEFVSKIKKETGIDVVVIDGDREAELIYLGVKQALPLGKEPCLIMDIGGGSTEFIIANNVEVFWKKSFDIGAARLLEKFQPSDPITVTEINAVKTYLQEALKSLQEPMQLYKPAVLIGSSGSFDSFADMIAHKYYEPHILEGKTSFDFNLTQYDTIYQLMVTLNRAERLKVPGMLAMRVDMIVIAGICTEFVLNTYNIQQLKLSTYALKEGVLSTLVGH